MFKKLFLKDYICLYVIIGCSVVIVKSSISQNQDNENL